MMYHDKRGLPLTAASEAAAKAFDIAVETFLANDAAAGDRLGETLAIDPDMVMAEYLRGCFFQLGSRAHFVAQAEASLTRARTLAEEGGATPRERRHIDALATWCTGDLARTRAIWEDILVDHPHDLLAVRLVHLMHFHVGDVKAMHDSTARLRPRWSLAVPGMGYVLGCHAFALEENGQTKAAEPLGRHAVELNEADIWAGHAVAHVLETEGRRADGIGWITDHADAWRGHGPFSNHLWWHRSLHYLELERYDAVLEAFDREVWPAPSEDNIDIDNAAAILMRLHMLGIDVGERWESVADVAGGRVGECLRPFNDLHFTMALAMSGRLDAARTIVATIRECAGDTGGDRTGNAAGEVTIADVSRLAGVPVGEAILAYAEGRHEAVVERMLAVRYRMVPLGGSWAQRDVWVRMLIDSAEKSGQDNLARALLAERVTHQPTSGPSWRLYGDALARCGDESLAKTARARARDLLTA